MEAREIFLAHPTAAAHGRKESPCAASDRRERAQVREGLITRRHTSKARRIRGAHVRGSLGKTPEIRLRVKLLIFPTPAAATVTEQICPRKRKPRES